MHDAPVPLIELPLVGSFEVTRRLQGRDQELAHISSPTTSRSGSYLSR
jgi:hypothetical protein